MDAIAGTAFETVAVKQSHEELKVFVFTVMGVAVSSRKCRVRRDSR
jgi:hypothetical protein